MCKLTCSTSANIGIHGMNNTSKAQGMERKKFVEFMK
jgi:hypothetical protein